MLKLLSDARMYPDHWHTGEDVPFYHYPVEREFRLAEEEEFHEIPLKPEVWREWIGEERRREEVKKVIFVDGVRKIHKRLQGFDGVVGGIAEIVIGHIVWSEGGVKTCESPLIRRFIVLPENRTKEILERETYFPTLEAFPFEIRELSREGEDRVSATVNNLLLSEEGAYLRNLVSSRDGFIVKDGTIHPGSPLFGGKDYGPVGLVKRVIREHLPTSFMSLVRGLRKGQRTPFYAVYLRDPEDILRIMCYLRLVELESGENPLKGIVRLETLILKRDFENDDRREFLKQEILEAFDFLASFISKMTIRGCDLPRSPENLPIVASLESWLSSFFLPSDYLSSLLERRDLVEDR
ncbi:MAG: hypothetical protein H5T91_04220 [Synergistetes bacterium]|nr:hypothetical protein [Synergistota bacterium]